MKVSRRSKRPLSDLVQVSGVICCQNYYIMNSLTTGINKMCHETQMPLYEADSRGGHHHHQNPRSRFLNLQLQYKGLVTSNMHMKYKSPITYHSNDMANLIFLKSGSNFKVKVTRSKIMVLLESSCHNHRGLLSVRFSISYTYII
jgi:hypothetical protein